MRLKKLNAFSIILCCIGFIPVNAQTGKLKLQKGDKLQVESTIKSTITVDMMGQSQEIVSDIASVKEMEVKEKKDASFIISSTVTKLKTTVSGIMGQSLSYDSDKKEDTASEMGKAMGGQVNVPKESEINDQGIEINIKKDTAEDGNPMMDIMKNMGGKTGGSSADVFLVLPAGRKSGDSWMDSTIADGIKTYKTYTIKEIKGKKATIALAGTMQTNKAVEAQGMEMNISMDSKLTGELVVDINTGIVKQNSFSMDGTGTMDMMGQSVPMTLKVTSISSTKD